MKNYYKLFVPLLIVTSCEFSRSGDNKKNEVDLKKSNTTEGSQPVNQNLNESDLESGCAYLLQYRYLVPNIGEQKIVFGEAFASNAIYCIEIGYGMGTLDYVYIKYDIDDAPLIVSCIKVHWGMGDQLEYEVLDKNEKVIESFRKFNDANESNFEQKMNRILEQAQKKAINLAQSIG
jgi:hypothetical protein